MTQPPETSGAIGFLTAPALLRDLFVRRATGQLVAYRGETVKKVFFKNGFVIYATSNLPADRLGDVLLARGMITREQYEESASQVLATGRKQGTVLVQIGALTPKDLFRGLIAQVREIVLSLFAWDAGSWRFLEGLPPQEEIVSLRLHPAGLLFEGLARSPPTRAGAPPGTCRARAAPRRRRPAPHRAARRPRRRPPAALAGRAGPAAGGDGAADRPRGRGRDGRAALRPRAARADRGAAAARAGAAAARRRSRRRRHRRARQPRRRRRRRGGPARCARRSSRSPAGSRRSSHYQLLGVTPECRRGRDQALVHPARQGVPPRPLLPPGVRGPAGAGERDLHAHQRGLHDAAQPRGARRVRPRGAADDGPGGAGRGAARRTRASPRSSSRRASRCSTPATSGRRSSRCAGR